MVSCCDILWAPTTWRCCTGPWSARAPDTLPEQQGPRDNITDKSHRPSFEVLPDSQLGRRHSGHPTCQSSEKRSDLIEITLASWGGG